MGEPDCEEFIGGVIVGFEEPDDTDPLGGIIAVTVDEDDRQRRVGLGLTEEAIPAVQIRRIATSVCAMLVMRDVIELYLPCRL